MSEPSNPKRGQQIIVDNEKDNDEKIVDLFSQMQNLVNTLGDNLEKIAQKQEELFLESYKNEMYEAQKKLREFNEHNNEEELRRKMDEKEEKLRKQREVSLTETLKISNKLKELKQQLTSLSIEADGLDDEVRFVEEQMILADEKNAKLKQELEELQYELAKEEIDYPSKNDQTLNEPKLSIGNSASQQILPGRFVDNSQEISNAGLNKGASPVLAKPIAGLRKPGPMGQTSINSSLNHSNFMKTVEDKDLGALKKELEYQKAIKEKLQKLSQNKCFEPVPFENLFYSCVKKVYFESNHRKSKNLRLPNLGKGGAKGGQEQMGASEEKEMEPLYEISFTDNEKKSIMEEFLSSKEVKEFIISKIFPDERPKDANVDNGPGADTKEPEVIQTYHTTEEKQPK